jgi:hypothetical protein
MTRSRVCSLEAEAGRHIVKYSRSARFEIFRPSGVRTSSSTYQRPWKERLGRPPSPSMTTGQWQIVGAEAVSPSISISMVETACWIKATRSSARARELHHRVDAMIRSGADVVDERVRGVNGAVGIPIALVFRIAITNEQLLDFETIRDLLHRECHPARPPFVTKARSRQAVPLTVDPGRLSEPSCVQLSLTPHQGVFIGDPRLRNGLVSPRDDRERQRHALSAHAGQALERSVRARRSPGRPRGIAAPSGTVARSDN